MIELLTHATSTTWIEVPLMLLIYIMLQGALFFSLQIVRQDLSILINEQDSTVRNSPVCMLLPEICVTVLIAT